MPRKYRPEPPFEWVQSWTAVAAAVGRSVGDLRSLHGELGEVLRHDPDALFRVSRSLPTWWPHLYRLKAKTSFRLSLSLFFLSCPAAAVMFTSRRLSSMVAKMSLGEVPEFVSLMDYLPQSLGMMVYGPLMGHLRAALAGETLKDLLVRADRGDMAALRKAIRIDPSVVLIPPVSNILVFAGVCGDKSTLSSIGVSLQTPYGYGDSVHADAKLVLMLMVITGHAERLTPSSAYEIFVEGAGVYDASRSEREFNDPKVALWASVGNWRREYTKKSLAIF